MNHTDKLSNYFNSNIKFHNCITKCNPPKTIYYHPVTLQPIFVNNTYTCATYDIDNNKYINTCNPQDKFTPDYNFFNIFDDNFTFSNTTNNFLIQVYNINNIMDVINFLNENIDKLPDYTQKRLLEYILDVYIKHDDFPLDLFVQKLIIVFNNIYNIKLIPTKIIKKIKNLNNNINHNFFNHLFIKYSK